MGKRRRRLAECPECGAAVREDRLPRHRDRVHGVAQRLEAAVDRERYESDRRRIRIERCPVCGENVKDRPMASHVRSEHGKTFCEDCGQAVDPRAVRAHRNYHKKRPRYVPWPRLRQGGSPGLGKRR